MPSGMGGEVGAREEEGASRERSKMSGSAVKNVRSDISVRSYLSVSDIYVRFSSAKRRLVCLRVLPKTSASSVVE
jgi:hypothetical protein